MAQKQDPRDTIIAELQAEVDYLMRTMKEVSVSEAGGYRPQGLHGRHGRDGRQDTCHPRAHAQKPAESS